jgi:hypothetical protein
MAQSIEVGNVEPYVTGTYTTEGNLFMDLTTSHPDCDSPATYAWTFDGQRLTFQVVGADPCADRQRTYETPLMYTIAE